MTNLTSALAKEIAIFYATSNLTLQQIADDYSNRPNINFKLSAKNISDCIYHCIFWETLPSDLILDATTKIANNQSSHVNNPTKNWLNRKYNETLRDREEYKAITLKIVNYTSELNQLKHLAHLNSELSQALSIKMDEYISSEEERDYVPLRNVDAIKSDIAETQALIDEQGLNYNQILQALSSLNSKLKRIIEKYSI